MDIQEEVKKFLYLADELNDLQGEIQVAKLNLPAAKNGYYSVDDAQTIIEINDKLEKLDKDVRDKEKAQNKIVKELREKLSFLKYNKLKVTIDDWDYEICFDGYSDLYNEPGHIVINKL